MPIDLDAIEERLAKSQSCFAARPWDDAAYAAVADCAEHIPALIARVRELESELAVMTYEARMANDLVNRQRTELAQVNRTLRVVRALPDEWSGKIRVVENDGGDNGVRDGVLTTLQWCLRRLTAALNGRDGDR